MLSYRLPKIHKNCVRFSSIAEPLTIQKHEDFRTTEINTNQQSSKHIGRYYCISPEDKKQLFTHGGLPKSFEKQIKTFSETALMIRKPAIEIMDCIKSSNMKNPTVRYVLYGEDGVGKSLTIAHLLHYGLQNEFILLHVPWVPNWFKKPKEIANSTTHEDSIDLPFDAAAWLIHFKTQNSPILGKLDLKTSRDYVWSKRETTPKGSKLIELIEHGIARVKFSSDTIAALISELKQSANANCCKILVAIDGYNAFFHPKTRIVSDNKVKMTPDKITITQPFVDITNYDWCNGICVLAVDKIALTEDRMDSYLPRYLLGKTGFEHVDPFVPIRVDKYDEKEISNCINYYLDRKWIQNIEPGFDKELKFLCGNNPFKLMNICAPL